MKLHSKQICAKCNACANTSSEIYRMTHMGTIMIGRSRITKMCGRIRQNELLSATVSYNAVIDIK